MSTIKDKLYFNFDGVPSNVYNLISINLNNDMFEETFVASRNINETEVRGNKPMFHSMEDSPLEFEMIIAFEKGFTDDDLDEIVRWLFVENYKPLFFEGKENRVYYCMPVGDSSLVHTGFGQGYFTLTMRCDSSKLYSQYVVTSLETVSTTKTITITTDGHWDVYPEISLKKVGAGKVTIESLDDGNNIFEVKDLTNQEDIYINCEKEIIETDAIGIYRYDKVTGNFPRFKYGQNRMKITGACTIQFRFKNKYRF